jgi:hypothetical protein
MRRNENGEGFEHGGELVRGGGRFLHHSFGQDVSKMFQTKIVGGNLLSNERKKIYEILKQKKNGNGSRLRDKGLKEVKTFFEET